MLPCESQLRPRLHRNIVAEGVDSGFEEGERNLLVGEGEDILHIQVAVVVDKLREEDHRKGDWTGDIDLVGEHLGEGNSMGIDLEEDILEGQEGDIVVHKGVVVEDTLVEAGIPEVGLHKAAPEKDTPEEDHQDNTTSMKIGISKESLLDNSLCFYRVSSFYIVLRWLSLF